MNADVAPVSPFLANVGLHILFYEVTHVKPQILRFLVAFLTLLPITMQFGCEWDFFIKYHF